MPRNAGFTLLEVMLTASIMVMVLGLLLILGITMSKSVAMQEARLSAQGEARQAMLTLTRELRLAAASSVSWGQLPGPSLQYRVPMDTDGNGAPVDIGGFMELGPVITVGPDIDDLNDDGISDSQLVWSNGQEVKVLSNGLSPNEDTDGDGTLGPGEDSNHNNTLDNGVWFESAGQGVLVTIRATRQGSPQTPAMSARLSQAVTLRN